MNIFCRCCAMALFAVIVCFGVVGCDSEKGAKAVNTAEMEEARKENQEKVNYLYRFIDSKKHKYDQKKRIIWVDSLKSLPSDNKSVYLYMGIDASGRNEKWINVVFHHSGEEWIYYHCDKITFRNDKEAWTFEFPQVELWRGGETYITGKGKNQIYHETADIGLSRVSEGLRILAEGENPKIQFHGIVHSVRDDCKLEHEPCRAITLEEVENIRTYLKLNEGIIAEKALNRECNRVHY